MVHVSMIEFLAWGTPSKVSVKIVFASLSFLCLVQFRILKSAEAG